MALDILGPASALNSVTTRPSQTTTYGATRSWFKACSSLTAQDGTQLTNDWLNNVLAQFRQAFDSTGIVEDNGDDGARARRSRGCSGQGQAAAWDDSGDGGVAHANNNNDAGNRKRSGYDSVKLRRRPAGKCVAKPAPGAEEQELRTAHPGGSSGIDGGVSQSRSFLP